MQSIAMYSYRYGHFRSLGLTKREAQAAESFHTQLSLTTLHLTQRQQLLESNPEQLLGEHEHHRDHYFVRESQAVFAEVPTRTMDIKMTTGYSDTQHLLDESFDQIWEEFAEALRDCGYQDVMKFDISKVIISRSVLDSLIPALATKTITSLSFQRANFGPDEWRMISVYLGLNEDGPLTHLDLTGNKLDDVSGVQFFRVVADRPSIDVLRLENCEINDDSEVMSALADTFGKLNFLDLRQNRIGNLGVDAMCNALAKNPSIKLLNLRDNDISDQDAPLFSKALATNTNLTRLCLQGTDITDAGIKILIDALFNTASMKAVESSNHRCQIDMGGEKMNGLECISWINRHDNVELTKKEKASVFREFKRNLPQNVGLTNPGDVRNFSTDLSQMKRERNASFRKAGKKAMLYLAEATRNTLYQPTVAMADRRSRFAQLRSVGPLDRKYCDAVCQFSSQMDELISILSTAREESVRLPSEKCKFLSRAKGDKSLKINLNFHVVANGQHQLMCHEGLCQQWRNLANAIESCRRRKKISLVEISNIQLSSEILEILLPSLTIRIDRHQMPMPRLVFNSNSLGKYEVLSLANYLLNRNNELCSLEVSGNGINNPTAMKELSNAIGSCKNMKCLKLESCSLGQSTCVMSLIISSLANLTAVYLSGNMIATDGAILIAKMLADNPPLQELYLNDNELHDADMVPVAKSLQTNTNLRKLYMRENFLTLNGEDTLVSALVNKQNIITIFNSNHTCEVFLNQSGNSRVG